MSNQLSSLPANQDQLFSYEGWRERFLNLVLRGACVLGLIAIMLYLFGSSSPLYKVLAIITYGILVMVTLLNKLDYRLRAGVFLALLYLSGFTSLIDHSMAEAAILFLGFIVMTGLFFSGRAGIY